MATAQELLSTISALEKQLASLKDFMAANDGALPAGKAVKAKKEKKARDPDAPPPKANPYFDFLNGRVRPLIKDEAGDEKLPGTVAVFFAKHVMSLHPDDNKAAYALSDDELLASYRDWATPENIAAAKPARKSKGAATDDESGFETASEGEAAGAGKPKRVLSEEQKAGRAAAKAGREAAKEAKKAAAAPAPEPKAAAPEPKAAAPEPKAAAAAPPPKFAKKEVKKAVPAYTLAELQDFNEVEIEGETCGVNKRGDVINGEGEFVGSWNGSILNREATKPADWSQVMA